MKSLLEILYLKYSRFRWHFTTLHKRGGSKFLVIPAKFKPLVKRLKILLTIISLLSAYAVFNSANSAFLFGLFTWLLMLAMERLLFSYDIMVIHPLPDFEWQPARWTAMGFGYAEAEGGMIIPCVSMIFDDLAYAQKIYNLLLAWSNGNSNDDLGLIEASVVLINEGKDYVFWIYPSLKRDDIISNRIPMDQGKFYEENPDLVPRHLHMALFVGKEFPISSGSFLPRFMRMYREDNIPNYAEYGLRKG